MSERYLRLYSLPENLHQEGSPVLISAGALLKDTLTNDILVQLKLRNISQRTIRSVKVRITAFDTAGAELKGVDSFSYLDLDVQEDSDFGSKTPIRLPDTNTRSFSVKIISVVCADDFIYTADETSAASVASIETLETIADLDRHRSLLQKQQKEQKLLRLSFLPLIPHLFIFAINLYGRYFGDGYGYFYTFPALFISLVVPCICITCFYLSKKDSRIPTIVFFFSIFFLLLQFFITQYHTSFHLFRYAGITIGGIYIEEFCGYSALVCLRYLVEYEDVFYDLMLLFEISFLLSYAGSLIILYQLKELYKTSREENKP